MFLLNLSEINNSANNWLINLNLTARSADSFNFIPTTSSLDVGSGSTTLNHNDYKSVYSADNPPTGNRTIPFDNFTSSFNTSGTNESHISFNPRNGDWLATELDQIDGNEEIFDCTISCVADINGVDEFCTGSRVYSVPSGADSYQWSVSSTGVIVNVSNPTNSNII